MAKQIGAEAHLAQARAVQEQLAAQGIDDQVIEQLFAQPGKLNAVLSDNKLLTQFFQVQYKGLQAITTHDFDNPFMAQAGQTYAPTHPSYTAYFSASRNPLGNVPGQDYFPEEFLFGSLVNNPTAYGFNETQGQALHNLFNVGLYADVWGEVPGQGGGSSGVKGMAAGRGGRVKGMAAGGRTKALGGGAPPPPPPSGGAMPPAPPAAAGGGERAYGFGGGGNPFFNWSTANFINSIEKGWARDTLYGLFQDETQVNEMIYGHFQNINGLQQSQQAIQNLIGTIDPTTPEGRQQMLVLNQQLGDVNGSIRQYMDAIQTLKRKSDERKTAWKGMMDVMWRTQESVIRNWRTS